MLIKSLILLITLTLLFIPSNDVIQNITISAIGDIMAHDNLQAYALSEEDSYLSLFKAVNCVFLNDDLTLANLETPIVASKPVEGFPTFNAGTELLDAIKTSGIEYVTIANNHLLDQGISGISETIKELDKRQIKFTGGGNTTKEAKAPVFINVNGIKIGMISATWASNIIQKYIKEDKPYLYMVPMDNEEILNEFYGKIRDAKKECEIMIVSYHAGREYVSKPVVEKIKVLKEFAESGADIVLSHHPHVLQPVEYYNNRDGRTSLIAYSLGNFISAQARYISGLKDNKKWIFDSILSKTAEGIILQFDLIKKNRKIRINDPRIIPIFNICFTKNKDGVKYTGFRTTFIEEIKELEDDQTNDVLNEIENIDEIKELALYRLEKIRKLIKLPIALPQ